MKRVMIVVGSCAASCAWAQPVAHDCVLWMRADQGVSVDGSGRVVSAQDLSGSGRTMTQGVEWGRPLLVANVVGGKPAMRFSGSQWLNISGQVLSSDRSTIVAVVNDTRTDGSFREVLSNWSFSNNVTSYFFGTTGFDPVGPGTTRARLTDDVGGANQGQTGVGSISNRTQHFIFTGVCSASTAQIYQARSLVAQSAAAVRPRNFTTPWYVGVQGNLSSEYWMGDIAEILVYNTDLSRCELDLIYDDLNARYGLAPCNPTISHQPDDATACPGGEVQFTVIAGGGTCDSNFSYQWFVNGDAAVDGAAGLVISGARTSVLSLGGLGVSGEIDVRCEITNGCGTTASRDVVARVCVADFNCDGGVDGSDVAAFFGVWEAGESAADLNFDGGVDFQDVETFFVGWEGGC